MTRTACLAALLLIAFAARTAPTGAAPAVRPPPSTPTAGSPTERRATSARTPTTMALSAKAGGGTALEPFRENEWQVGQGRWRFLPDGELRCEGKSYSSLLYRRGVRLQDLDFAVEVMFLAPSASAALFFRAEGQHLYHDTSLYQFEWYTAGRHHGRRLSLLVKRPPWRWRQLVIPLEREPPLNRWLELRVRAEGEVIEGFVDDTRVFTARDRTYLRPGRLGLHVFMPTRVRFRNPRLRPLESRAP